MKCPFCNDPIYKYQKTKTLTSQDGTKIKLHAGCFNIMLDRVMRNPREEKKREG